MAVTFKSEGRNSAAYKCHDDMTYFWTFVDHIKRMLTNCSRLFLKDVLTGVKQEKLRKSDQWSQVRFTCFYKERLKV